MNKTELANRRPRRSRSAPWVLSLTESLAIREVTPNQVSITGLMFAIGGSVGILCSGLFDSPTLRSAGFMAAAAGVLLRMACSILDGMLAIEADGRTPLGALYNELPDRISELLLLVAFGYSIPNHEMLICQGSTLGWAAAVIALLTAYIRTLGLACGGQQVFTGPMGGPERLAALAGACIVEIAALALGLRPPAVAAALWLIVIGGVVTCWRRVRLVSESLQSQPLVTLPLRRGRSNS